MKMKKIVSLIFSGGVVLSSTAFGFSDNTFNLNMVLLINKEIK